MKILDLLLKKQGLRQFFKFCVVGVANTVIDYSVYLFFTRWLGVYFLLANIAAILTAMTFSFFVNKYWTFQNKEKELKKQYLKFALVMALYFLLYNAIFFSLVKYFNVYDLLAKVVAIIIGLFWNFFASKHFAFKSKDKVYLDFPSV